MKKPIFIAEVGMNYNKNFALASELIKQAAISGADIVKFQLGWRDKPGEINVITKEDINPIIINFHILLNLIIKINFIYFKNKQYCYYMYLHHLLLLYLFFLIF